MNKLRDQVWQFVGVLLALVALLVPLFTGDSTPNLLDSQKLMIYPTTRQAFLNFQEPLRTRARLFIGKHEERDVRLYVYFVEYSGNKPLRKEDFQAAIRGAVPQDRKIIAVQKASDTKGPMRMDKESGDFREAGQESMVPVEIKQLDQQSFEVEPVLMNPGDWFKIDIYTAAQSSGAQGAQPSVATDSEDKGTAKAALGEIEWKCRAVGVDCPAPFTRESDSIEADEKFWFLRVKINHRGWAIYFILLFTIINTLLLLILARKGAAQPQPTKELFIISLAIASSLAVAEVLADLRFNGNSLREQPSISLVMFLLHILFFISLVAFIIRRKINTISTGAQVIEARPAEESEGGGEHQTKTETQSLEK